MNIIKKQILVCVHKEVAESITSFIKNYHEAIGIDENGNVITAEIIGVIHDKADSEYIRLLNPDIIFNIYCELEFTKDIIDKIPMGIIDIHLGNLPEDRGPDSVYWAVRRGDDAGFATLRYIDEGMDTGDVIASKSVVIRGMNGLQAYNEMVDAGISLFKECYADIMCSRNQRKKQNNEYATCNTGFRNSMRYINWNERVANIIYHISAHEGLHDGSIAWSEDGVEIVIHEAHVTERAIALGGPGFYIYDKDKNELIIQTNNRKILVNNFICTKGVLSTKGIFVSGTP
jgi:methionyl-tRNA formyltransferase